MPLPGGDYAPDNRPANRPPNSLLPNSLLPRRYGPSQAGRGSSLAAQLAPERGAASGGIGIERTSVRGREAGETVVDGIVVSGIGHEDVANRGQARRGIERAGRDADLRAVTPLPEH